MTALPVEPVEPAASRASGSASRWRLAPWALVGLLAVASIASGIAVVQSVQGIASAFLAPPPLASSEWVQRIVRLTSQELAFGVLVAALVTAAGASVVIALAAGAVRRGARIAVGVRLVPPAVLGAVLVAASVRLAQADSVTPELDRVGVTGLLTSPESRGIPTLSETLGFAGVLILAGVVGCAAVSSRLALVGCVVVALALALGTFAAINVAAAPIDALMKAPAYPARSIEPDPFASTLVPVLALGAGAFVVAALGSVAARARRR